MNPPAQLIDDLRVLQPPDPYLIYYWVGGVLAAVLLTLAIWLSIRWVRKPRQASTESEIRRTQDDALKALNALFSLIEAERGRHYAIESSSIIRHYIERRFQIRAPHRSTDEFLHEAQHSSELSDDQRNSLGQFLRCCDFLKFAQGLASRSELEELHDSAVGFVRSTTAQPMEAQL